MSRKPRIIEMVKADLDRRDLKGVAEYGDSLREDTKVGAAQEAYDELLDGVMYFKLHLIRVRALESEVEMLRETVRLQRALTLGATDAQKLVMSTLDAAYQELYLHLRHEFGGSEVDKMLKPLRDRWNACKTQAE